MSGFVSLEAAHDLAVVHVRQRRSRRLVGPGHPEPGVRGLQGRRRRGRGPAFASEEEHARACVCARPRRAGERNPHLRRAPGGAGASTVPARARGCRRPGSSRSGTAPTGTVLFRRAFTTKSRLTVQICVNRRSSTAAMAWPIDASRSRRSTGTPPMSARPVGRCSPGRSVRCHSFARVPAQQPEPVARVAQHQERSHGEGPVGRPSRPPGPEPADDEHGDTRQARHPGHHAPSRARRR